jgi:hypothetical protein
MLLQWKLFQLGQSACAHGQHVQRGFHTIDMRCSVGHIKVCPVGLDTCLSGLVHRFVLVTDQKHGIPRDWNV